MAPMGPATNGNVGEVPVANGNGAEALVVYQVASAATEMGMV